MRCSSFADEQRIFCVRETAADLANDAMQERKISNMANCPECGGDVPANAVERGEILPCPDCGAQLEVRELTPLTLTMAPEIQEDWGE